MSKKKRLIWQLYPTYLLITILSMVAITWFASSAVKSFFLEQTATDLEVRALLIENQIRELMVNQDEKAVDRLCKVNGQSASTRITVILASGKVIGDSEKDPLEMDNHADRPEFIEAITQDLGRSTRFSRTLEKNLMYVGIPVMDKGQVIAVIRTSVPVNIIDKTIRGIQTRIIVWGLLIAILSALLSLLVSRRISRPIEQIKNSAECFARGDFQCSLPSSDTVEIATLSESMKGMSRELSDRFNTIKRQRNETEAMLSSMVEGVIAVDTEERVISMNNAAAQMLECDKSLSQGRTIQEAVRNSVFQDFVAEVLQSQGMVEKDIVLAKKEDLYVNAHGTMIRDAQGERIGALFVLNDVTRLRTLENIRRDFVANVSHELKTPITAIKGFVETLMQGEKKNKGDTDRFLKIIDKHVRRLTELIEDLLSLSRIEKEAESGEISFIEGNIRDTLRTAIQLCENKAESKNIEVILDCDKDITAMIDPPLLEQAIVNLLDNAIKYSNEDSQVNIDVYRKDNGIIIDVRDQGQGIEKVHLARLFERFYRVDKARSRDLGGTGLGLAIVKHIIQAHKGNVRVESSLGEGTVFTITLPGV